MVARRNFSKSLEVIETLIVLIIVAISILSIVSYNFYRVELSSTVSNYGSAGLFFSTLFLEFIPQFLTPFFIPLVGISSGLSLFSVIFFVILGSFVGSILAFEFGKYYGWSFIYSLFKKETTNKILKFWNKYGTLFVFLSAISPLPYVPLVFGALDMPRRNFWIWGIIPRALAFLVVILGYYFGIFQVL